MSCTNQVIIEAQGLSLSFGERRLLEQLDIQIERNKISAILGANGCGKSTLLKLLSRMIKADSGKVWLKGKNIEYFKSKALAKERAYLTQKPMLPDHITVLELIQRGRYPHQTLWCQWSKADEKAIRHAISLTGLEPLLHQQVHLLSGGQQQRVWLAMVLTQDSEVFLLDEPTSFLDIGAQLSVLDFCRKLKKQQRTLILVLHDMNQAIQYADHLIFMHQGSIVAQGKAKDIISHELIEKVYGIKAEIHQDQNTGLPYIKPVQSLQSVEDI
tara:strand:- start:5655 stop:6467 length:813 start_codon:yes stop_codon:yes gene_type:complete